MFIFLLIFLRFPFFFFFFNDTATTEIYTLSLHDALPISAPLLGHRAEKIVSLGKIFRERAGRRGGDRKSTRLNSSHVRISYAVFCLKKKKKKQKALIVKKKKKNRK